MLPPHVALLGVVLPDYLFTVIVAIAQRRAGYLFFGLFFVPLRCVDAWLCLRALAQPAPVGGRLEEPGAPGGGQGHDHGGAAARHGPAQLAPALTSAGSGNRVWPEVPALAPAIAHSGQERSLASLGVGSYSSPCPAEA